MDAQRALLDRLMGPNRNRVSGKQIDSHWDDANVCPWYLISFCPHDLFKNTKEDLGPCPNLHAPLLAEEFQKQPENVIKRKKYKYCRFLEGLVAKGDSRIQRAKERLQLQLPSNYAEARHRKQMQELDTEVILLEKQVESLGEAGKVQEAQAALRKQEVLKNQLTHLREQKISRNDENSKPLVVCEICGGFIVSESGTKRLIAHENGRMHQGYLKIRNTVKELKDELKGFDDVFARAGDRTHSRSRDRSRRPPKSDRKDRADRDRRDRDRDRSRRSGSRRESESRRRRRRSRSRDRR